MWNLREIEKYLHDDFFGNFNRIGIFDEKEDFFGGMQNQGNFYCESYSTKITYDKNGQKVQETKAEKKLGWKDEQGNRFVETQKQYQNSGNGLKKQTQQRAINEQEIKVTRKEVDGKQELHRKLKNVEEKDLENFNQRFNKNALRIGNREPK